MSQANKLAIQVYGSKYNITTGEDPGYVKDLAGEIDKTVTQLVSSGRGVSVNEALVLVALSYLDQYKKAEESADNLRSQIAEYLEDAAKARMEADEARRQLAKTGKAAAKGASGTTGA